MEDKIYHTAKLNAALAALEKRGIDTAHVFEGTELEPHALKDGALRVSSAQILHALRNISERFWHPHLPYEIGSHIRISAYGMYGYAVLCSTNYLETVAFARKFHHLAAPTSRLAFSFEDGAQGWEAEPLGAAYADRAFYTFLVNLQMGIFNALHNDVVGDRFHSDLIELRYPEDSDYTLPPQAAKEIRYGAAQNRFHVSSDWFERPLERGNTVIFQSVVQMCERELSELSQQNAISAQVRNTLLQSGYLSSSMEEIADRMNLTSRTLRRHLKREETTFSEIVDMTRTELAVKYLREADLSIEEIARVLGFSETASFVRAFKRCTGKTPKAYRISA
ncbi:AraC family transcriptional regulator ligand-binding domain-containing protein [Shimia sp.]|uniref:helix-turn-helix transcriptional regulator n=1 Tax=Shimia sp. TaxID=1954381 RepID=UPI003BAA96BD